MAAIIVESVTAFLKREKPPIEKVLDPILSRGGAAMIWGPTGIGKSRFGMAISFAIATGGSFLKYQALKALKVLYIAAEMTEAELQQVIQDTIKTFPEGMELPEKTLTIMHHMHVTHCGLRGIPKFGAFEWWDTVCMDYDVIVIDNLYGVDPRLNSEHFNEFIKRRNAENKSVIIQHHAGKSRKQQLGDVSKEFHLETVIELRTPADFRAGEPARFEIHYHKHRNFFGSEAQPVPAVEMTHDEWVYGDIMPEVEEMKREKIEYAKGRVLRVLPNGPLTTTELIRDVFQGHLKAYMLKAALSELETEGLIKSESFGRKGANGKRYSLRRQDEQFVDRRRGADSWKGLVTS